MPTHDLAAYTSARDGDEMLTKNARAGTEREKDQGERGASWPHRDAGGGSLY